MAEKNKPEAPKAEESKAPAKVTTEPAPKPATPDLNAVPPGTNEGFVLPGSSIPNVESVTKAVRERVDEKEPLATKLSLFELYVLVRHIRGSEGENFLNEVFNRSKILLY